MYCLKQLYDFASLNNNIYIGVNPNFLDIDPAAHVGGPTMCTMMTHLL